MVLDAFVAASFIGFIGSMLSADAVQRGRSLFADREGEEVADPALRLADDGTDGDGPASAPFDGEGVSTRRTGLIEDGRLLGFLYDSRTARKAGRSSTGNASRGSYRSPPSVGTTNLVIEPGEEDLAGLARLAGDGLYVTDVAGLHSGVNPVSGTFSVGASGRLIEGGELGTPVRELTIASDLVSMLKAVRSVGSEVRWVPFGGSVKAPPILGRRNGRFGLLSTGKARKKRPFPLQERNPGCFRPSALLRCARSVAPGKEESRDEERVRRSRRGRTAGLGRARRPRPWTPFWSRIQEVLSRGGEVNFTGFGKFSVADRSARQGVNPQTGEKIQIAASRVPRFSAGSSLKSAVKSGA